MNKYSRRYYCPKCNFKGRASREMANTGTIRCPLCKTSFSADLLYRKDTLKHNDIVYFESLIKYNDDVIKRLTVANNGYKTRIDDIKKDNTQ